MTWRFWTLAMAMVATSGCTPSFKHWPGPQDSQVQAATDQLWSGVRSTDAFLNQARASSSPLPPSAWGMSFAQRAQLSAQGARARRVCASIPRSDPTCTALRVALVEWIAQQAPCEQAEHRMGLSQ